jgi:hypothetical protein
MTWVIAYHGTGYVSMISDIQVTWIDPNGIERYADVLRKSFVLTPNIAIGFAGSVEFGLESVNIARELAGDGTIAIRPDEFADKLSASLRARIDQSQVNLAGGLGLLIAGVNPFETLGDAPIKRCFVATLDSANAFTIQTCGLVQVQSVGSGRDAYREHFEKLNDRDFLLQHQGGDDVPMPALRFAYSTYTTLEAEPADGISRHMHFSFLGWHEDGPEVRQYSLNPPLWLKAVPEALGLIRSEWHAKTTGPIAVDAMPTTVQTMQDLENLLASRQYTASCRKSLNTERLTARNKAS